MQMGPAGPAPLALPVPLEPFRARSCGAVTLADPVAEVADPPLFEYMSLRVAADVRSAPVQWR